MFENKALMRFQEFRFKGKHLKSIPADQAAFLALLFSAYNDINILLRLQALNAMNTTEPGPVRAFGDSTKLFLARTVSSKLFEVIKLLEGRDPWNKSDDKLVRDFSVRSIEQFAELTSGLGFQIARALRTEVVSHYSLKAARKSISTLDDAVDLTLYAHKNEGNSFAQLGEAVVFTERFRTGRLPGQFDGTLNQFQTWLDWTGDAGNWMRNICADFLLQTMPLGSEIWKQDQVYYLDEELVGDLGDTFAPLFLREPTK